MAYSNASEDANLLRQLLHRLRFESLEHDVVFVIDGVRFPTHRNVVAAVSPVFRAMFTNGMKESTARDIILPEVSAAIWRRVEDFIYTGIIQFDDIDDALAVLDCSVRFQIDLLQQQTLAFLAKLLNQNTCICLLLVADQYNLTELFELAMKILAQSIQSLGENIEFAKLDEHLIEVLLKRNDLQSNGLTEFKALMNWLLRNQKQGTEKKKLDEEVERKIGVLAWEILRDEGLNIPQINASNTSCGILDSYPELIEHLNVSRVGDNELKKVVRICRKLSSEVMSRYQVKLPVVDELFYKFLDKLVQAGAPSDKSYSSQATVAVPAVRMKYCTEDYLDPGYYGYYSDDDYC